MNPATKPLFERACDTLGLQSAVKVKAWRAIADLQLDPDDPTVILLAIGQAFGHGSRELLDNLERLPGVLEAQAHAALAGMTSSLQNDLIAAARDEMHNALRLERAAENRAVALAGRRQAARSVQVAICLIGLVVVLAGSLGYVVGRADTRDLSVDLARVAAEASAGDWLKVMELTPGFSIASNCDPDRGDIVKGVDGTSVCLLRVDLNAPYPTAWSHFSRRLMAAGWWLWPALGALFGAICGYLWGRAES